MQYITVNYRKSAQDEWLRRTLADEYGCVAVEVEPSVFSFITSARLMTALKHAPEAKTIVTQRLKDVMAAMSLRQMTPGLKLIYAPGTMTSGDIPRTIASEILQNIDLLVFASEREKREWAKYRPIVEKSAIVIDQTSGATIPSGLSGTFAVTGEIEHPDNLLETIKLLAEKHKGSTLLVVGRGKAGKVMPVVKEASRLTDITVEWLGDKNADEAINGADAILQSGWRLTDNEASLIREGKTVYNPFQSAEDYSDMPTLHVEQWAQIIRRNS